MNPPAIIDSERLDLPSASDAYPRRRCLGRYQLIQYLKSIGKLAAKILEEGRSADGRYASFGNGIHAAWAGQKVELDGFQLETLEKLIRLEQLVVTDWAAGREIALFAREQRLWLHSGITPLHSGRYDVAYITTDFAAMLIIDGKTLTHPVAPADSNDQLRELVALAHFNYPAVKTFTVAILQPHVERSSSVATYDELEAELALRLLRWHLNDIRAHDLPRIFGDWCRYCPAMEYCPEARAAIEPLLAYQFERDERNKLILPIGQEGTNFVRRLVNVKHLCETILAAYKALLEDNPDDLPGFTLKPGKTKRSVTDAYEAFSALKDFIPLEDLLAAFSPSVTKLQAAYGAAQGLKGKPLREAFNSRLDGVIEWKTDAPSLEDIE
jgi:hypothetical protein